MALAYVPLSIDETEGGTCSLCGRSRVFTMSCDARTVTIGGVKYRAIAYGREIWHQRTPRVRCSGCGAFPNGLHHERCVEAECPACGGHLTRCRCR